MGAGCGFVVHPPAGIGEAIGRSTGVRRRRVLIERMFAVATAALLLAPAHEISAAPTPVAVGAVFPSTGPFASGGVAALEALGLAVETINADGGVLGHPLRLMPGDSQGRPEIARAEALRLADRDHVWVLIGAYLSEETLPVQEVAAAERTLHVVPIAATMEVTDRIAADARYRYSFRVAYDITQWAGLLRDYLRGQRIRTYAFVGAAIRWNQELAQDLRARLEDHGISELSHSFYSPTAPLMDPIVIALRARTPDVVVLGDPGRGSIEFVKRARELGLASQILSVGGALGDLRVARTLAPGAYLAFQAAAWRGLTPEATKYWAAFQKRYHYLPVGYSDTLPHDALMVVAEAARAAGSLDRDRVAAALATGRFPGVAGIYRFDSRHQAVWGEGGLRGVVIGWVNGEDRVIFPSNR
jgi:branched-chain amino acid transport system substrate-binding protein